MSRSFRTKVVGVTFSNNDGTDRQEIISKCDVGENVQLRREYGNSHDEHAIAVLRETGEQIGFIAKEVAFRHEGMNDLAPHIDQGGEVSAKIVDIIGVDKNKGFFKKFFSSSKKTNIGCILEINVGGKLYLIREAEGKKLRDEAKSLEKKDPNEAIHLYRQSMAKLIEVDKLVRETYAFQKQIIVLKEDLGTWRRTPFPIERITSLLEKNKEYTECLAEIEKYEKIGDKKGLSKSDAQIIIKRKNRIVKNITV